LNGGGGRIESSQIDDEECFDVLVEAGVVDVMVAFAKLVSHFLQQIASCQFLCGSMAKIMLTRGPMAGFAHYLARTFVSPAAMMAQDQTPDITIAFYQNSLGVTTGLFLRERFDGAVQQFFTPVLWNGMISNNVMECNEVNFFDCKLFSCQHATMLADSEAPGSRHLSRKASVQQEICDKLATTRPWAALAMTPHQFAFESQALSLKQRVGLAIDEELPLVRALLAAKAVARVALAK
jgi:hypothetical protein